MAGLFDTFTISKRGLSVQQGNINVSAHNIANASTVGFSRQRAVIETTRPFGGNGKFDSCVAGQIGTGAQIATIQRIRNEFVDYQVRDANGILANSEVKADFLSKIQDILGETSDEGIQGLLTQFYKSLQSLTSASEKSDIKSVVIQNALSLTDSINYTYNQLKKQLDNAQDLLGENVVTINTYLDQINELNKQIRRVSSLGQSPNDLMDSRDVLLDELSSKFGINIDKQSLNAIDLNSDEYDNLKLVNADPNDLDYNRFSTVKSAEVVEVKDPNGDITGYKLKVDYYKLGNTNSEADNFEIDMAITGTGTNGAITQDDIDKAKKSADAMKKELEQCRILIADNEGKVSFNQTINSEGKFVKVEADGTQKFVDSAGKYVDANGYRLDAAGNYLDKDGNVTTDSSKYVKTENEISFKQSIFKTYEYESGVNNVSTSNDKIKGEIAGAQSVQFTIQNYMNDLDKLAASIAYAMNAVQTGSTSEDLTDAASQDLIFVVNGTNSDKGISAATITVNKDLIADASKLNCKPADDSGNGANDRAQAMATLLTTLKFDFGSIQGDSSSWNRKDFLEDAKVKFDSVAGSTADKNINLTGQTTGSTLVSYYSSLINKMGSELKAANNTVSTQETVLNALENQRLSESGVSLDEEMTDLITFQHAYQANAKMISTIDELLDVVINGLKR